MRLILGIDQKPFAFEFDQGDSVPIAFATQLYKGLADEPGHDYAKEFPDALRQLVAHNHADDFIDRVQLGERYLVDEYEVALTYVGLKFLWGYQKFLSNPFRNYTAGAEEIGLTADELVNYSLVARDIIAILEPEVRRDVLPEFAEPSQT